MTTKQDARKLDALGKEDLRRRVVRAVLHEGLSKAEAARVFGVSRTSVHAWLNLYHEHGLDGLTPKRTGRPRGGGRLKGWQAASIVNTIKDKCPDQLKLPFALWTREAVRDLIHIKFGIRYGLGMVGRLLRRWGFTPQKPVTRAYERDDAKIRAWVKREYPVLHRRAQREKRRDLLGRRDGAAQRSSGGSQLRAAWRDTGDREYGQAVRV
jgi:transposase